MANPTTTTDDDNSTPPSCPISPAARDAWLESAKETAGAPPHHHHHPFSPPTEQPAPSRLIKHRPLAFDRETSSIPRAFSSQSPSQPPPPPTPTPTTSTLTLPASHSQHSAPSPTTTNTATSTSASTLSNAPPPENWIYPSERQFHAALLRKNLPTSPTTVSSIVPIHNAVNERAWAEILSAWELRSPAARRANAACGGPRLRSFQGDSARLTPRARVYGWLGYERPFDRHDWVVERCGGETVEYVIDFYRGRGGGLSFFLDVRPKLNSWAGWKLRVGRWLGL